jgi:PAS domain S-box-containing protein
MIMLVDEADLIVKANLATAHLTGRTLPQIIGTSIFALLPHESLPRELHPLVAMRRTGGRAQAEFRTVALGGWFLMTAEPSMEGGRRTGGAVITLRDITDVKLMERALTEARDTWEETFNTIQEGITIHDGAFRVLRANAAARRMLGRLDKPIEGHLCHEIFHGTDRPIGGCPGCESFRTGFRTTVNLEEPFLGRYLEITALPRPDGTIIHVFHDISERKQAMDELARAAQRVQGILERSPFGIFVVGEELLVEFANPAILSITGAGQEEFVGTFIAAFPAFRELSLTSRIQDALEEIPFRFGPAAFPCGRDGRVVIGHFTGLPLQERGQRKVLVFVEDVTDLKEAEEERLRLTELLLQARKMESIGTLASGIAHDFNNILLAVIGLSDAVAERIPAGHPAREDLGLVIGAAERGSNLVRQLLAFSRQQALKMQPLDLRQLVDETCRMLARMLPKNIAIEVRGEGALPAVVADAGQVEQVLMNLAINARDAMPEGGTLSVETTTLAVAVEDESHPGVSAGYWVVLVVRDSGIGMSAEVFPRIFDPFFTTKERGKGTGLGLASVYGIVSQHGGSVRAESAPGQGSTFFVYLPAAADAERGTLPPDLV